MRFKGGITPSSEVEFVNAKDEKRKVAKAALVKSHGGYIKKCGCGKCLDQFVVKAEEQKELRCSYCNLWLDATPTAAQ